MSKIFLFSLYFTSFAPLWVSVLFIDIKSCIETTDNLWTERISIACIVVLMAMCMVVLSFCLRKNVKGSLRYYLQKTEEEKTVSSEYLLSYILPLFAFDFTEWNQVILFLVFFVTLLYLCMKHNYFGVNIVLEIAKFKCYKCSLRSDEGVEVEQLIFSRKDLNACKGEEIILKSLNNQYKLHCF